MSTSIWVCASSCLPHESKRDEASISGTRSKIARSSIFGTAEVIWAWALVVLLHRLSKDAINGWALHVGKRTWDTSMWAGASLANYLTRICI
jgi:hypothetical protein